MQCLDENEIVDLLRGKLSPASARDLQTHIDVCDVCRVLVAEAARQPVGLPRAFDDVSIAELAALPALDAFESAAATLPHLASPPALAAGAVVEGRYRLERPIGEGGAAVVWAATELATSRHVALKFLKSKDPEIARRFAREARVMASLTHPCILHVHDVFLLADATSVMAMDLLHGESLARRLTRGALTLDELRVVLLPVLSAVGSAHAAGIVHRDLKPANIFLTATGPKVLDFGLAKIMADAVIGASTRLTRSGFVMGTPSYMSPEQVFADRAIDQRADVWALGVIVYECVTGARPIAGSSLGQLFRAIADGTMRPIHEVAPHLPPHLSAIVMRMLAREKEARPDLREVYAALSLDSAE